MFGFVPAGTPISPALVSVTLGTVPGEFVLTDVIVGVTYGVMRVVVKANGTPVFCAGESTVGFAQGSTHLTTGILIPSGSTIAVEATSGAPLPAPITLAGYLQ